MLYVTDNADDLPWPFLVHWIRVIAQKDLLPDWIFVGKEAMREGLVHDDRPRGSLRIVLVQIASFSQRNPESAEEARTDFIVSGTRPLVWRRFGVPEDREGVPLGEPGRQTGDGANRFDSRQRGSSFQQLLVKRIDRRHGPLHVPAGHSVHVLSAFRQLNAHGQKVARIESGMHSLQTQN